MNHAIAAQRVLLIGLDGATYDVLTPLTELGLMPNLARLMQTSALAQLESTIPCITPVAWTTIQTGCDPLQHGIVDYRYFDHRRRQILLNQSNRIHRPTLFDHLAAHQQPAVSLSVPMTYPAPPVSGVVVGGLDSPSTAAAQSHNPEFSRRLQAAGIELRLDTIWQRRPSSLDELSHRVNETETSFREHVAAARIADEMTDWRLLLVQFQALDSLQHRCWHLLGLDRAAPVTGHAWTQEVRRAFRTLDQCIGDLMELAVRRNAAVLLLSDHGFGDFREKISVREVLRRRGLLTPASLLNRVEYRVVRNAWKLRRAGTRYLQSKTVVSLSRPLGSLAAIDWRRTQAVALHGAMAGLVYLNTPERFGRGPVVGHNAYQQTVADVIAALREVVHPETGEHLFTDAFCVRDRLEQNPLETCLPDVIAVPAPGFHTRAKPDRMPKLLPADPAMSGTHRSSGVLMVQAAGVATGKTHAVRLQDIAPTVLKMLGIAPTVSMSGRVLDELWTDPAPIQAESAGLPVRRMASPMTPTDQSGVEARLRELGYID